MSWVLTLGDCLDPVTGLASLGDKSVDHVITDPPYEAEAHTKQRRVLAGGVPTEHAIDFAPISAGERSAVCAAVAAACRGWFVAFCQLEAIDRWRSEMEAAGMRWRRACIWHKPDGMPQLTSDRPAQTFEAIATCWAGESKSKWNGGGRGGFYQHMTNNFGRGFPGRTRPHPTMKPLALMEQLLLDFTDPGDTILDPFAGSGTTGVAAIRLGRNFIGWEKDPKYHAAAMKRLSAAREQLTLLGPRTKAKQETLL